MCFIEHMSIHVWWVHHWKLLYVSFVNYSKQRKHACQLQLVATAHSSNVYGVYGIYQGTGLLLIFSWIILPTEAVFFLILKHVIAPKNKKHWEQLEKHHFISSWKHFFYLFAGVFCEFSQSFVVFPNDGRVEWKTTGTIRVESPIRVAPYSHKGETNSWPLDLLSFQYLWCRAMKNMKNGNLPTVSP